MVIATSALKMNIIEPLSDRIMGRTSLHDIYNLPPERLIIAAGEEISETLAKRIEEAGIETVRSAPC